MELQKIFFAHWKGIKNAPFDKEMEPEMIEVIYNQSIRRSDRYQRCKAGGLSEQEIKKIFIPF